MIGVESAMPSGGSTLAQPATSVAATEVTSNAEADNGSESGPATEDTTSGQENKTAQPKSTSLRKAGGKTVGTEANPAEAQAYTPNHKFKVLDKEHEFDEWAKNAAKDPETEKKIREIYEKAYGIDSIKQDRHTLKSELAEAKEKIANTDRAIETIGEYAKNKDWDSFFEALSIPKNEVLQYALALVQREQMPPEQRQQWEAQRQAQQQAKYYQQQNQSLQQQQQQFQIQQRDFELNSTISKPEYVAVAEAYNAGMANPSAFRNYVIQIGQAHAARGNDISADQAVQEAISHLRAVNPTLGQQAVAQAAPKVVSPNSKPTIPNIQGRGTSAVKSTIRSLDDLKARAKELESRA